MEMPNEVKKDLCRKLRIVSAERGSDALKNAVMIGSYKISHVSNIPYITCATIGSETLGQVDFQTARLFEDA